jgi:glycosyltransferase involved in cell wall biosynthesis
MRVLQLGPYPPPHGGVQSNLVAIHRFLQKRGISSQVINITRHRKSDGDGVYYPKDWLGLCRLLLRLRFDIVHLHIGGTVTPRLLALSFLCCAIPGRRAVLTFHSGGYPSSKEGTGAHPRSLRGFVFRRFDRIIGVNPEIVRLFHRFGVEPEKVRLIQPHALPSDLPARNMPEHLKRFFETHEPVLLTVGLLEPEYDLPIQIDALGIIRERHPKAGLMIIGSGSIEGDLGKLIAGKSYGPHILLCGDVPHEDTLLAVNACDLFLRTSIYDGDSVAVREALHLGAPVIATDTGMRPPDVHLIAISNPGELVRAIEEHLPRPRERRGSLPASEENIEAVVELYRELMHEMRKGD